MFCTDETPQGIPSAIGCMLVNGLSMVSNAGRECFKVDLEGEHPHCITAFTSWGERTSWLSSVLLAATTISCCVCNCSVSFL